MSRARWWMLAAAIAALAVTSSINGLWNDFVYDDRFIIVANPAVHDLSRWWTLVFLPYWPLDLGGDGYRPLTLLAFAVQWAATPASALLFHAVNIALYALTAISVFWLASVVLPLPYAWLAAAIFAVHPVHVEAVANVVGQSELWVGLIGTTMVAAYLHLRRANALAVRHKVLLAIAYLVACLFKEHAIVLPALLVGADLLVGGDGKVSDRLRRQRPFFLALAAVGLGYLFFRGLILPRSLAGYAPFIPFQGLRLGAGDRILTMLGVVPHWLRLMVWPAQLSSEYGPPAYPIGRGFGVMHLAGVALIVGTLAIGVIARRRAPVATFGILWFGLTLLPSSNVLLPSGILLAERTLFMPSIGFVLAVGAALPLVVSEIRSRTGRIASLVLVQGLLVAGIIRSVTRTEVWETNDTLFRDAVRSAPRVYRSHYMLGAWLSSQQKFVAGEREYLTAISLFPHDPFVFFNLANEYFAAGMYEPAYQMYERSLAILPDFKDAKARMALCRAGQGRLADAGTLSLEALRAGSGDVRTMRSILMASALDRRSRRRP